MELSKSTVRLLVEMVENEETLAKFLKDKFENLSRNDDMKLRSRLKELRESGIFQSQWADNIPYNPSLTHLAKDYLEEHGLLVNKFDKYKLIEILRNIGGKYGITNILIYDIQSCGQSQIGWKQTDEQEWKIKIEAYNMVEVKKISKEIESELLKYDLIKVEMDDDDSTPRFKRYIDFAHKSIAEEQNMQGYINTNQMHFSLFFNDFMDSCLALQGNKRVIEGSEDDKTMYIRDLLTAKKYTALDQTQRGNSGTGIQAGEVDLLILDNRKVPFCVIEALVLKSVDKVNINSHIDKISKYDGNGLSRSIVLNYVFTADFDGFLKRYKAHITTAKLDYPLSNVNDFSNPKYSEVRLVTSTFTRSGMERELIHVLLNLPR
jgi:hypothetical protein